MSNAQESSYNERVLSEEEQKKLEADTIFVSDFKQTKLELEAKKNWDLFYKRNTTKFFKDRHWTTREFEELIVTSDNQSTLVLMIMNFLLLDFIYYLVLF